MKAKVFLCLALAVLAAPSPSGLAGNDTGQRRDTTITTPAAPPGGGGPKVSRDPETGDRSISVTSPANSTEKGRLLLGPIIVEPRVGSGEGRPRSE
ncbi:MAG: hypothetical protein ACOCWT_01150 [Desulfohalobiaceae bacterium]